MNNRGLNDYIVNLDQVSEPAKKLRDFIRYIPGRIFYCSYQDFNGSSKFEDELNYWVTLKEHIDEWIQGYSYLSDYIESKDFWKCSTKFEDYNISHTLYLKKLNAEAKEICTRIFAFEAKNYNMDWLIPKNGCPYDYNSKPRKDNKIK